MYNNYNRIQCKKIRRDSKTSNIGIKQEKCKTKERERKGRERGGEWREKISERGEGNKAK